MWVRVPLPAKVKMIKFLIEVVETVKWVFFGHPTSPLLYFMLPGGRSVEVAEQRQLSKQERDFARMFANLPAPEKEGQKITLVGQGFVKDVIVRQGRWQIDG